LCVLSSRPARGGGGIGCEGTIGPDRVSCHLRTDYFLTCMSSCNPRMLIYFLFLVIRPKNAQNRVARPIRQVNVSAFSLVSWYLGGETFDWST